MRHRHGYKKLGRDPVHRRALLKNLAIALIKHERIVTTLAKAKELRRTGDKMIGLAKKDTDNSRKTAWNWMRHPDLMDKLFGPLKDRYITRPGGYTRVLRMPNRTGDNAPMAVVELVDNRFPPLRPCRDSYKARQKLQASSQFVTTEDLSQALGKLDLHASSPAPGSSGGWVGGSGTQTTPSSEQVELPHSHASKSGGGQLRGVSGEGKLPVDIGTPV